MPTVDKSVSGGTFRIVDNGPPNGSVEFHINADDPAVTWESKPYSYTVNNQSSTQSRSYPTGGFWLNVQTFSNITLAQTVRFTYTNMHPQFSGGSIQMDIQRPGRPQPPTVQVDRADVSSVYVTMVDGFDNFFTITGRQIGFGTTSIGTPPNITTYTGANMRLSHPGLYQGNTYYFRGRTFNSYGWSDWSSPVVFTFNQVVLAKVGLMWKLAEPYVNDDGVWKKASPYVKENGLWKQIT